MTTATQTLTEFEAVVVPWISPAPPAELVAPAPMDFEDGATEPEPEPEPRLTRFVALCALLAWLGVVLVAASAAQVLGLWAWAPTDEAVASFACLVAAALVSTLWLPGEGS